MAEVSSWNLVEIKKDLIKSNRECMHRGLMHGAKWAAEMSFALDQIKVDEDILPVDLIKELKSEYDNYTLAKSYFDLKEYDRAAYFIRDCTHPLVYFLHMYARYLSGEKKRLDDAIDSIGPQDINKENEHLRVLRVELHKKFKQAELDGYGLYLYGVILKKLDLVKEAVEVFIGAVHSAPLHWSTWLELGPLTTDKEMLQNLALPDHWLRQIFIAHTYLGLQYNEEALAMYNSFNEAGFSQSTYILAQVALAYHNLRVVDLAVESFCKLQKRDPYRLENMDIYSNLLYVKEMRADLAYLAHHCCSIDKYTVQTCCIIGNYYSLRTQHEKAVMYFQRALRLNPSYLAAWTLMGHEYIELKNTSAAIKAYRQAIEVYRRDYRAWYGLGQIYDILKMPFFCLYYYRQAQMLRPNDSRMLVALGEAYEKLDRLQEAKKCFWKAHSIGDVEGMALIKLAKLYEKLKEEGQAHAAYTEFLKGIEQLQGYNMEEKSCAYRFLANYHLKHGNLEEAYEAARKCTEYNETREEGKALLQQISRLRAHGSDPPLINPPANAQGSLTSDRVTSALHTEETPPSRLLPMNLKFTP